MSDMVDIRLAAHQGSGPAPTGRVTKTAWKKLWQHKKVKGQKAWEIVGTADLTAEQVGTVVANDSAKLKAATNSPDTQPTTSPTTATTADKGSTEKGA